VSPLPAAGSVAGRDDGCADFSQDGTDGAMKSTAAPPKEAFRLVFRTHMTPWTQECVWYVVVSVSDLGIGVERDVSKGGLGLEEQWFAPWGDVLSIQHGHLPEPIIRVEFATAGGQTAVRDIRIPPIAQPPFRGCSGPHLVEAIVVAYQETGAPPSVEEVLRVLAEIGATAPLDN
jgi:hypothetical protein